MKQKRKNGLILGVSIFVIVAGIGGFMLWKFIPAHWSTDRMQIIFPIADIQYIDKIQGWGATPWNDFHNGIDFGSNQSVELIAWCDIRISGLKTWFNDGGGHWQTNIAGNYNWKYRFDVAIESWALNETYANLQRAALTIKVGQIVEQGESLGMLLYHGSGTHIHFGLKENGKDVCPYQFMTPYAQSLTDQIWTMFGPGGSICNNSYTP